MLLIKTIRKTLMKQLIINSAYYIDLFTFAKSNNTMYVGDLTSRRNCFEQLRRVTSSRQLCVRFLCDVENATLLEMP